MAVAATLSMFEWALILDAVLHQVDTVGKSDRVILGRD